MPDKERQDRSLSAVVVKEAVGVGMDTPLREPILEAVEESEGTPSVARRLPLVGAALGIGAGIGYLLGSQSDGSLDLESVASTTQESDVLEETLETVEEETELTETEEAETGAARRLPRVALLVAIAVGIALIRRRMRSGETEEWEPIEEFDTTAGGDEDESDEEADESEATDDETMTEEEESEEAET